MIYSVKLKNFKQHLDYTAVFNEGLNAVTGENGSGKTTVLKAILFSLFGVAAAGSKDHLTTWGQVKMQVETDLLLTVGRVTVTRSLTKAEVRFEGELLASGQTAVTSYIESQLGMDAKLFKSMLYAGQGETQLLLKMGAAGLQKQLEIVANIEVIDKVITQIALDNVRAEGQLQGMGEVEDINALRALSLQATLDRDNAKLEHDSLLAKTKLTEQEASEAKRKYDQAALTYSLHTKLSNQLSNSTARLDLLLQQKEQLEGAIPTQTPPTTLLDIQNALKAQTLALTRDTAILTEHTRLLKMAETHLANYQKLELYRPIIKEAKQLEAEGIKQHGRWVIANDKVTATREAEHSINCLACKRPLEGKDIERIQAEHQDAMGTLSVVTGEYGRASGALDAYLREHNTTSSLLRNLEQDISNGLLVEAPAPIEITEVHLAERQVEISYLSERLTKLQLEEREYNLWLNQWNKLLDDVVKSRLDVANFTAQFLKTNALSQPELEALYTVQALAQADWLDRTKAVMASQQRFKTLDDEEDVLCIRVNNASKHADKVHQLQHQTALRSELQKYLRTNRAAFMEDSWAALTNYASHLINSVTDGLINNLSRSASGDFYVLEGGQPAPVEELSGARKSIVGLCLRLSLAHLFYGVGGFVLLDEVTADCSENNAAKVAGMLRGLQSQVIMVTHRQSDATNANHSICLN